MNSALQCLTHTPQLVEYFLQDFTKEINRTNPLGMKVRFLFVSLTRPAGTGHFRSVQRV